MTPPFTGLLDVDIETLNHLSDKDLFNMCQVNKYARYLCNSEDLWKRRIMKYTHNTTIPTGKTWREHYIDLVNNPVLALNLGVTTEMMRWILERRRNREDPNLYDAILRSLELGRIDILELINAYISNLDTYVVEMIYYDEYNLPSDPKMLKWIFDNYMYDSIGDMIVFTILDIIRKHESYGQTGMKVLHWISSNYERDQIKWNHLLSERDLETIVDQDYDELLKWIYYYLGPWEDLIEYAMNSDSPKVKAFLHSVI